MTTRSPSVARLRAAWAIVLTAVSLISVSAAQSLPDSPEPQISLEPSESGLTPCRAGLLSSSRTGLPPGKHGFDTSASLKLANTSQEPCPPSDINLYRRFLKGPPARHLTPSQKAWLASRNLLDPFELTTILADSSIAAAAKSHSAYGHGFDGLMRRAGVSFTQEMTVEFVDNYSICSFAHQDPRYHREPTASIPRRALHAALQAHRAHSDEGERMPNYANLVGFAVDDQL